MEEDEILRTCGPLTAEDRVFRARHPERPHIDETVSALCTDFFEQRGDRQCKEDPAILGGSETAAKMAMLVLAYIAVSYTHLDVYKRQPIKLPLRGSWRISA